MSVAKSAGVPFTFKGKVARGISFPFQGKERSFGFLLNFNRNWEGSAGCPSHVRGEGPPDSLSILRWRGPLESCQFQRASKRNPLDFLSSSERAPLELFSTFEGWQCPGFLCSFTGWVSEVPFNFKRFHFQRTGIRWIPFQIHGESSGGLKRLEYFGFQSISQTGVLCCASQVQKGVGYYGSPFNLKGLESSAFLSIQRSGCFSFKGGVLWSAFQFQRMVSSGVSFNFREYPLEFLLISEPLDSVQFPREGSPQDFLSIAKGEGGLLWISF